MSIVTTAPTAKANLLTLLQADTDLAGVQVVWAHPGSGNLTREAVYFGATKWQDEWSEVMGPARKRDERYRIEVVFDVASDGDDAQACETRMWALVNRLRQVLHDHPTLSTNTPDDAGPVFWALPIPDTQTPAADNNQRVSLCIINVECRARV